MRRLGLFLSIVCLLLATTALQAGSLRLHLDDLTPKTIRQSLNQNVRGFRIGVALSGGGARGFAHIGVLEALEEMGIDIDIVAGTSMGGIIGGLYAAGMSPQEIEQEALQIDWSSFFSDRPRRTSLLFTRRAETEGALLSIRFDRWNPQIPTALSTGQKLVNVLSDLTQTSGYFSGGNFANLERRLAIVAVDLVAGERIVFTDGSLVEALRATMGVPLAFTPLERGNQLLMDGGLLEPIPTAAARQIGADFVIAVNTTSDLLPKEKILDPVDIANQTTTILSAATREQLLAQADFVVAPDLHDISATDFRHSSEAIAQGYDAALAACDSLTHKLAQHDKGSIPVRISRVEAVDRATGALNPDISGLLARLTAAPVTDGDIAEALHQLFRTGAFASLDWQVMAVSDTVLRVEFTRFPIITHVNFEGNRVFPDSTLRRIGKLDDRKIETLAQVTELYSLLFSRYRAGGYDLAQVKGAWLDTTRAELTIVLDEGQIVALAVEGNSATRSWVAASYFPLQIGDFYSKPRALRGVQEIYNSGLYDNVNLRLEDQSGGVKVTIIVKENKFTFARLGARYHEDFHPEAFVKLGYANLFGTGQEITAYARFSERRKLYQLQLRADRIFRTFLTYRIQGFYANNKIGQFIGDDRISHRTDKRWGTQVGVGQQLLKLGLVEAIARYEQIRFTNPPAGPVSERRVASLIASLHYDTKDRFTFPTRGQAVEATAEIASNVLGADEVFTRLEASAETFQRFGRKLVLHPRVAIGLSQDILPVYDRFYLGGTRSFYGYETDQLAGDKYLLHNLELRLGPIYSFYLSGRYDVGDVFSSLENVRFSQLRHGFGATLSLDTPVGPLSVSYGGADGTDPNLYLNLGFDF